MNTVCTDARCPTVPSGFLKAKRETYKQHVAGLATFEKIDASMIRIDFDRVDRISERLHQRINYYCFFHDKELTQSRQAAIKAYWTIRYHPIQVLSKTYWTSQYDINVHLAFFILFAQTLGELAKECSKEKQRTVIHKVLADYKDDYVRALSEYDIGKESMMLLSDSLKSIVKAEIKALA